MTSTNFTFNNTVYTANDKMTYFYRWPEGRKGERVRIKKADFESAYNQFVEAENARQNAINEFTNIDPLLKAAEDPTISVEEYCEMIEEANKPEEPKVEPETPKAPKAKKARKSKDIAYTYSENGETVVTLTARQVDFVKHLPDTCFWENGLESSIWVDCLCDEIGGQFAGKPMTVGAMISTLCEKGLGFRTKEQLVDASTGRSHKCTSFELTDLGKKVFAGAEWGLE